MKFITVLFIFINGEKYTHPVKDWEWCVNSLETITVEGDTSFLAYCGIMPADEAPPHPKEWDSAR